MAVSRAARFERDAAAYRKSPLRGVADDVWDRFVRSMSVQSINSVSPSGGLGSYDMRPRRLVELERMTNLRYVKRGSRNVHEGDFVHPLTRLAFLGDPVEQYEVFVRSMAGYFDAFGKEITLPEGVSRSGALAVLHRGGRGALEAWPEMFSDTKKLFDKVKDLF